MYTEMLGRTGDDFPNHTMDLCPVISCKISESVAIRPLSLKFSLKIAYLNFDEIRFGVFDQLSVAFDFIRIPGFDQRQSENSPLALATKSHVINFPRSMVVKFSRSLSSSHTSESNSKQ